MANVLAGIFGITFLPEALGFHWLRSESSIFGFRSGFEAFSRFRAMRFHLTVRDSLVVPGRARLSRPCRTVASRPCSRRIPPGGAVCVILLVDSIYYYGGP